MCGIAGLISLDSLPLPEHSGERLRAMASTLHHRGPDDHGTWLSGDHRAGLAHTRLAIIDPTPEAHQPMISAKGNALVFNGEVYNYRELREKHKLAVPMSDTAVLLALLDRYGERILPELRGFFTFAYWNDSTKELLIARDAIGKKPLYFAVRDNVLLFASEARTLVRSGLVTPVISVEALREYLAYYSVPHPLSIFEGVMTLPAGCVMRVLPTASPRISNWYRLPEHKPIAMDYNDAVRETRRLLEESVRYRMVSDVPIGAFLSGGLDSNAIVGLMSREVSNPIETFSIGFRSNKLESETDIARIGAKAFGTQHHETIISDNDVSNLLPAFFRAMDSPTGDGLNTFLVAHAARAASPSLKVVLSGIGSDELFLGYRKHRWLAKNERLAKTLWALPEESRRTMAATFPKDTGNRFATALRALLDPKSIRVLFSPAEIKSLTGSPPGPLPESDADHDPMIGLLRHDIEYYLHDTLLRDLDQMTMAHSLEARAPLLDKGLLEFAWQLPLSLKAQGTSKQLLADAVSDVVPKELLQKPKSGFELPMHEWLLRGALRPHLDLLLTGDLALVREGVLRKEPVAKVYRDFVAGRSHYLKPWSIIVLDYWWRENLR